MNLKNRLGELEVKSKVRHELPDWMQAMAAEWQRERAVFVSRVPADLRAAVEALLQREYHGESLSSWIMGPFARWAPPVAEGFEFPRALVEFWLNPPRPFWGGNYCERCGLLAALFTTWSNDPDPPQEIRAFPACPACCGRITFAAYSARGPETEAGGAP